MLFPHIEGVVGADKEGGFGVSGAATAGPPFLAAFVAEMGSAWTSVVVSH